VRLKRNNQPASSLLRLGVVRGGKLQLERLLKVGTELRVGTDPRCAIVLGTSDAPQDHVLVRWEGRTPILCPPAGSATRMATRRGVHQVPASGTARVEEGGRARINIGDVTVLLQRVPAPPRSAREQGRAKYRPRLLDPDDPRFLGILSVTATAFTTLALWAVVQDEPTLSDEPDLREFFAHITIPPLDSPADLPVPPPVPTPKPILEPVDNGVEVARETPEPLPEPGTISAAVRLEERRAEVRRISRLIGGLAAEGGGIFDEDDATNRLIVQAIEDIDSTGPSGGGAIAFRTGTAGPEGTEDRLVDFSRTKGSRTVAVLGPKTDTTPRQAKVLVKPEPPEIEGEPSQRLRKALAGKHAQVQHCYVQRLNQVPTLSGRVVLELDAAGGRVTRTALVEDSIGDGDLADCILSRARRWRLPSDFQGTLTLPYSLSRG
jgi:hypothetical protein